VGQTPLFLNPNSGKITLQFYGATYLGNAIDEQSILTFFDFSGELSCGSGGPCSSGSGGSGSGSGMAINSTLGWYMGFREPFESVSILGNVGVAVPDLSGPSYFVIVLDDLNRNHINTGLIGITELSNTLSLPSYYRPDLPYYCIPANPLVSNLNVNSQSLENDPDAGVVLMDKLNITYSGVQQVLPSGPRTLTQAQLYSINTILKNNQKTYDYKLKSPSYNDTFAIIPLKAPTTFGQKYSEFGGTLQDNKREYYGPTNISRLRLKLYDDKGNLVNLNGTNWTIVIIAEILYQY
jgi:hypothetical protein